MDLSLSSALVTVNSQYLEHFHNYDFMGQAHFFRKYLDVVSARLQLGPYFVKWQLAIDQELSVFPINYFGK